jgi:PAS domain S-box-containing protein
MRESVLPTEPHPARQLGFSPHQGGPEFRRLLEKLPAGAYLCDPEGLITYYNQRAVELWGRSPKLHHPEDRFCGSFKLFSSDGAPIDHDQCWMALALRNNREYNGHEILIDRPDGSRLTAMAYANPIRDESGELIGAMNVLVDITNRKRAEETLKEADRRKDEFLAMLAHELRNPLASVHNALAILRKDRASSPESEWALGVIERQTQQLTRLVEDLLDVSRITRGKLELRKERVELAEVLREAVETSRPHLEADRHELTFTEPPQAVWLDADRTRLAQAFANLLNNAAKYTEPGGRVWLSADRQGSDAVVSVRDNGVGIPAEMLSRIFELFAQVDRSLERAQGGLGIGLTLVKRLIEMHGGSVSAHSDGPGKGSEFVVRLPLVLDPPPPRAEGLESERASSVASLRILIVDDNEDAARSLGVLLRIMGNEIRTAHDGLEAVSVAEEFRPDVAVMDIGLPRLSGYEAARKIRGQPWGAGMTLIAVTGWGQEGDRQRSKEAGFDHHMVKPVNLPELMRLLTSLERSETV